MYMIILNGTHNCGFSKDVVCRLINSPLINGSTFLLNLAIGVMNGKISTLTINERIDHIFYNKIS